jgi:hypothetical protein
MEEGSDNRMSFEDRLSELKYLAIYSASWESRSRIKTVDRPSKASEQSSISTYSTKRLPKTSLCAYDLMQESMRVQYSAEVA